MNVRFALQGFGSIRPGTISLFTGLVLANVAAWVWAFAAFSDRPAAIGTALLAWVLGLRHAVDADHIAAIDNVVRKLMHAGDSPRNAGLYFSLGHSTVVVAGTILLAAAALQLGDGDGTIRTVGSLIGTAATTICLVTALTLISDLAPAQTSTGSPSAAPSPAIERTCCCSATVAGISTRGRISVPSAASATTSPSGSAPLSAVAW